MYPSDYLYTREHEWVLVEDDIAKVGITDFAQGELGDVVFVELPDVGKVFNATDLMGTIESVKAVSEFFAPIGGEVIEVNNEVYDDPELLNDDPHGEGWLLKMRISNKGELKELMNAEVYEAHVRTGRE